jgi:hypothetical protein
MSEKFYQHNLGRIKSQFQKGTPEYKNALEYLNSQAQDPNFNEPVKQKQTKLGAEIAEKSAKYKGMSMPERAAEYVNGLVNMAGVASIPSMALGAGIGLVGAARPALNVLANQGAKALAKKAAVEVPKAVARVAVPVVGGGLAQKKGEEIATNLGAGPNVSKMVGNLAGAGVGLASNPIVNKVLPQKVPLNIKPTPQRLRKGTKAAQATQDWVERKFQPGGAVAWDHPKAAAAIYEGKTFKNVSTENLKAKADMAFKEMNKVIKKDKKNATKIKQAVTQYMKGADESVLPEKLRNSTSFKENIKAGQARMDDFTEQYEMDLRHIGDDLLYNADAFTLPEEHNNADKYKMLRHIADIVDGKVAPNAFELSALETNGINKFLSRGEQVKDQFVKALRNPSRAQAGTVRWNQLQDRGTYLPQRYASRVEGLGFEPDGKLLEAAVEEQMAVRELSRRDATSFVRSQAANSGNIDQRGSLGALQAKNIDERTFLPGRDDALMKYMGLIEDPEFLYDQAVRQLTESAGTQRTIAGLKKAGLASRNPNKFANPKRLSLSGANDYGPDQLAQEAAGQAVSGAGMGGYNHYIPDTLARALIKDAGSSSTMRGFDSLGRAMRDAKVVQNIPGQIRNMVGDVTQMYLGGASPAKMPRNLKWAYDNMKKVRAGEKADDLYEMFRLSGIAGGGMTANTVRPNNLSRSALKAKRNMGHNFESVAAGIEDIVRAAPGANASRRFAEDGEEVRRMAFARDVYERMNKNASGLNSAGNTGSDIQLMDGVRNEVDRVLIPYDRPSGVTSAINRFAPVSSWRINATMAAPGLMLENPGRATALGYVAKAINDGLSPLGVGVDFNSQLPLGGTRDMMAEMDKGVAPSTAYSNNIDMLSMGMNPVVVAGELARGQTTAGYDIRNDYDSFPKQAADTAFNALSRFVPGNIQQFLPYASPNIETANFTKQDVPGGNVWNMLMGAIGQRDKYGQQRTTPGEGAAKLLGVPLVRKDKMAMVKKLEKQEYRIKDLETRINAVLKRGGDISGYRVKLNNEIGRMKVLLQEYREEGGR